MRAPLSENAHSTTEYRNQVESLMKISDIFVFDLLVDDHDREGTKVSSIMPSTTRGILIYVGGTCLHRIGREVQTETSGF